MKVLFILFSVFSAVSATQFTFDIHLTCQIDRESEKMPSTGTIEFWEEDTFKDDWMASYTFKQQTDFKLGMYMDGDGIFDHFYEVYILLTYTCGDNQQRKARINLKGTNFIFKTTDEEISRHLNLALTKDLDGKTVDAPHWVSQG